jgi:hypothetical protein
MAWLNDIIDGGSDLVAIASYQAQRPYHHIIPSPEPRSKATLADAAEQTASQTGPIGLRKAMWKGQEQGFQSEHKRHGSAQR